MQTLVIYDIPDDACRNRIMEKCKDYGLERIQYSCFLGDLNQNKRQELALRLKSILKWAGGDIQVISLCDKDFKGRTLISISVKEENKK